MFRLVLFVCVAARLSALTVEQSMVGAAAEESTCAVSRVGARFESTEDHVYYRFVARRVRAGDRLTVEWVDPSGQVSTSAAYESLPTAASLCFVTALPVGGFPAAQQPGAWTVRVVVNDTLAASRSFEITGTVATDGPRVTQVTRDEIGGNQTEVTIAGRGFVSDSVVNIAQYTKAGGWNYIAVLIPAGTTEERMAVRLPALEPAEYLIIVRNPDGAQSAPARWLVSSPGMYKLPTPAGVPWVITQGPYGGFSHYGRSRHAWDIAPRSGACVVAMRGGVAHTSDKGWKQTPNRRIFGNYITVAHDDGEFSHYAHLRSGTFFVKNGQRVEQGQPLATAGNSGYTVGQGGGVHVHVHVTKSLPISSPSIPFRFDDLDSKASRGRAVVVASNNRLAGDCGRSTDAVEYTGSVAVTEVWSQIVRVDRGASSMEVRLEWASKEQGLDLSLVSPSGRQYALYADTTGFAEGGRAFRMAAPEPGQWLVCVRGIRGNGERAEFRVESAVVAPVKTQKGRS